MKSTALAPDLRLCTDFVLRQYHTPDYNCHLLQLSVTCCHAVYLAEYLLMQIQHLHICMELLPVTTVCNNVVMLSCCIRECLLLQVRHLHICMELLPVPTVCNMLSCCIRECALLQVRHRCTCTNITVCGEEAKLVETLAKQGKMPPFASQDSQFMTLSSD